MKKIKMCFVLFAFIMGLWGCSSQRDFVYLSKKFPSSQRDSVIYELVNADSMFYKQSTFLFPFDIYMFGGKIGNYLLLNTNVIDTSKFNIDYFVKKDFIKDFIEKDKKTSDAVIRVESTYLYNSLTNHTQTFSYDTREWCHKKGQLKSIKTYLHDCFPQGFYDLIGSLIYNNTLDYVFAYPTQITYDEELIGTKLSTYFGVKGKDVYIIYDNWTDENEGNEPQIIPIEEYLNCCWDTMTNVSKK